MSVICINAIKMHFYILLCKSTKTALFEHHDHFRKLLILFFIIYRKYVDIPDIFCYHIGNRQKTSL